MQRSYLLLIFLMVPLCAFSQINESFSDNDFINNPAWIGETAFFTVNTALQLQSNGPGSTSQLHLSTSNSRCRDTEWNFYTKLDLDITATNWARIYLTSDRADTENNPKGYYVKFDGTTNSVDLYKQDSTKHTKIISGKTGRAGKKALNVFRIKVICDAKGNWYLFSDSTATGNNFVKEGTTVDTTFSSSSYCGIYFAHTSTKRMKFYFDDFTVAPAPLSLLAAKATSATSLVLVFNRNVDPLSAQDILHYSFLPNNLQIISALADPTNKNIVHLSLSGALNTTTNYTISATAVLDDQLNSIGFLNSVSFHYKIITLFGDLILTELFPDPSPQNGLPEFEYVEVFNRKTDTLDIQDFTFSDGSTTTVFPSYKIPPKHYLLVCHVNNLSQFSSFRPVLGVATFPSLNNSGDDLFLKNQDGVVLHEVNYSDTWYGDNDKKEGGWSLEMIDLDNPCGEELNWTASVDVSGGTPAKVNSVWAFRPDTRAPDLLSAFITDSIHVQLTFDEKPDISDLSLYQFYLDKNITVKKFIFSSSFPKRIVLEISNKFVKGETYKLTVSGIKDCNGNSSPHPVVTELVLPQPAVKGDILLNEVLFNPRSGGYDFVELFNRSSKYIDLKNWQFANSENGATANKTVFSEESFILQPNAYAAFTENKSILLNQYPFGSDSTIFQIHNLPSYNDDQGTVILLDSTNKEQDRFDYSEDMHYALIDNKEGVSLERISASEATNNIQNWESASSQSGYATPGYRNSQNHEKTYGSQVWVEPKIFTPDQNGDKDFALINYKFDTPGNTANITVFDYEGREMIKLVRNELLGSEGFYKWEGNNMQDEKVRSGVYVVYFELFNLKGEVKKYKETVVVGWSK
jgi:hypothetical protein